MKTIKLCLGIAFVIVGFVLLYFNNSQWLGLSFPNPTPNSLLAVYNFFTWLSGALVGLGVVLIYYGLRKKR